MKLSEHINLEDNHSNKIRFIMNYRIVPAYLIFSVVLLVAIGILMSIDEEKYTPVSIGLFIVIGIASIVLLASVPFIRKKEIESEINRYDFDTQNIELKDVYNFSNDEVSFCFDKNGMFVNESFYWYNHLKIFITTSNSLNRIWISTVFFIDEDNFCEIPLDGEIISMIYAFNMNLENPELLKYIIEHKEDAFTKIYKLGTLKLL